MLSENTWAFGSTFKIILGTREKAKLITLRSQGPQNPCKKPWGGGVYV